MDFLRRCLPLLLLTTALLSCKKSPPKTATTDAGKGTYFSMAQFVGDQVSMLHETIYTLEKRVEINGQKDSSIVSIPAENWAPVYAAFLSADIGKPKFLGKYRFSQFDEEITFSNNYVYEALEENLPVRRLMISANAETHRIQSLLAEVETSNFWGSTRKKLYYAPLKVIQIQEWNTALIGADKTFRAEYRFLVNRTEE